MLIEPKKLPDIYIEEALSTKNIMNRCLLKAVHL